MEKSNKGRIGDVVELKACAWLMEVGFEVFRNVSSKGPIDIVAVDKQGVPVFIDVKKVTDLARTGRKVVQPKKTSYQQHLGVKLLFFCEKTHTFSWTIAEIRSSLDLPSEPVHRAPLLVDGYTLGQHCKQNEVNVKTVRQYMKRTGKSLSDAILHAKAKKKSFIYCGQEFRDITHACNFFNIPRGTMDYWLYEVGITIEEALDRCRK